MRLSRYTRDDKEDKIAMLPAMIKKIRLLRFACNNTVGSSLTAFRSLGEN